MEVVKSDCDAVINKTPTRSIAMLLATTRVCTLWPLEVSPKITEFFSLNHNLFMILLSVQFFVLCKIYNPQNVHKCGTWPSTHIIMVLVGNKQDYRRWLNWLANAYVYSPGLLTNPPLWCTHVALNRVIIGLYDGLSLVRYQALI